MELRFAPGPLPGDPFDHESCDVRATLLGPGGHRLRVPAFYDGDGVWAVRHSPDRTGLWRLGDVRVNGRPHPTTPPEPVRVERLPDLRIVRRDPRRRARLREESGRLYWPLGHNLAWSGDTPGEIVRQLGAMGDAGLNWTRIWMCHWDGKNLDWPADPRTGGINRDAARRWDAIVAAAEAHGVRIQLVLQHHGPYSTRTDSNWGENPWSRRNGGFLETPDAFFTDPEARRRTRRKLRYAIARWGYSPALLAWELFNEVEWTDAIVNNRAADVAAWHREMAGFLRAHDPWRHPVTTSARESIAGLYDAADYVQPHAYPADGIAAVANLTADAKPRFHGEIGPGAFPLNEDDGRFLRPILWTGIATQESGAPQYWDWETTERRNLYPLFRAASRFVAETRLAERTGLKRVAIQVETQEPGRLTAGPGVQWASATRTRYPIGADGQIEGIGTMPAFVQGEKHREMFPFAELPLETPRPAVFRVILGQIAKAGARATLKVDGAVVAEKEFPATLADHPATASLEATIPTGRHTIRLENGGVDWFTIARLELDPFGPALRALGRAGGGTLVAYLWKPGPGDTPIAGKLTIPGLGAGAYTALWWDTEAGQPLARTRAIATPGRPLVLETPPLKRDAGLFVTRE